jgi:hypothetical protein
MKRGIEKSEATKVAAKNATVTAARVFIDEELVLQLVHFLNGYLKS